MTPNGATMTDMQPLPLLAAVGLLLGTPGVLVRLPCCGATPDEPGELVLGEGDGLGDGLEVVCVGATGATG